MRRNWTFEKLKKRALRYQTRKAFQKGSPSAYQIAWRRGLLDEICSHMEVPKNKPYTHEELRVEALKYGTRKAFEKGSPGAYHTAHRKDILDQICSHMDYVRIYWTYIMLQEEALKYKNRGDFVKYSKSAYQTAHQRGILDQICSHMSIPLTQAYSIEELQLEANKYATRSEFIDKNPSAYTVARIRGILDQICSHMVPARGPSLAEKELFSLIKAVYPEAKKIMDRKVSIPNKPYIQGFEIDILVGKLGIEFDGKYHHSFEYMRKSVHKRLWSDDDIRNYHKLKDDWFATKGIQILHIKEEDWKKDKKKCIRRCMKFLEVLSSHSSPL